jgi:hypothetical protein
VRGTTIAGRGRMRRALLLVFLAACSQYKLREPSIPPLDALGAPPVNAARVCVVRTSVIAGAVTFPTRDNGHLVGATRGPGHFCWLAEPGDHEITIETDHIDTATLRAEAGKAYWLKQGVSNMMGIVTCEPQWIDYAEAQKALEGTPYEVLSGVPGEDKLPEQPPFVKARAPAVQGGMSGGSAL